MLHRGSARAPDEHGGADFPFRPMVKFQFYGTSEHTGPSWDAGPLGEPGAVADWGALDGVHGSAADSPQITAVWDDTLAWLRGDPSALLPAPPAPHVLASHVAAISTDDTGGEARRMGSSYLLGRAARTTNPSKTESSRLHVAAASGLIEWLGFALHSIRVF